MLYKIKHKTGYCLSRQGKEQDGGYVNTLCQHVVMLPIGIEEYNGNNDEVCPECKQIIQFAREYGVYESSDLRELAQKAYQYGDRHWQTIFELALEMKNNG